MLFNKSGVQSLTLIFRMICHASATPATMIPTPGTYDMFFGALNGQRDEGTSGDLRRGLFSGNKGSGKHVKALFSWETDDYSGLFPR